MASIENDAQQQSAAAQSWVIDHLGSPTTRARLDPSLAVMTPEQLLERLDWEMARLPIIHNAPVSDISAGEMPGLQDDTPLNVTLRNGYLQNVCHRYVFGGSRPPESKLRAITNYANGVFHAHYHMPPYSDTVTAREANECMIFCATNIRKQSIGLSPPFPRLRLAPTALTPPASPQPLLQVCV